MVTLSSRTIVRSRTVSVSWDSYEYHSVILFIIYCLRLSLWYLKKNKVGIFVAMEEVFTDCYLQYVMSQWTPNKGRQFQQSQRWNVQVRWRKANGETICEANGETLLHRMKISNQMTMLTYNYLFSYPCMAMFVVSSNAPICNCEVWVVHNGANGLQRRDGAAGHQRRPGREVITGRVRQGANASFITSRNVTVAVAATLQATETTKATTLSLLFLYHYVYR